MTRYLNVTWNGDKIITNSDYGKFRRNESKLLLEEQANELLKIDGFNVDNKIYDNIGNIIEELEIINDTKNKIGIAREYGLGDVIMTAYFLARSIKINDSDSSVTLYALEKYHSLLKTFNFLDEIKNINLKNVEIKKYNKFYDLSVDKNYYKKDINISRQELFTSEIQNPIFEFDEYKVPSLVIDKCKEEIDSLNYDKRKIVGISILSESAVRSYPPTYLNKIVSELVKEYFVIIFGQDKFKWSLKQWKGSYLLSKVDCTPDLLELAGYMSLCNYGITTDNGLMHLWGILKIPTLSIFGNIDPSKRVKFYPKIIPIYPSKELPCIPCNDAYNPCPHTIEKYGGKCLSLITPERLLRNFSENIVKEWDDRFELFRKIISLYTTKEEIKEEKLYPYIPSKTPIKKKEKYKVLIVVPHMFLGGGETQLMYLLDSMIYSEFDFKLIIAGPIDNELYPRICNLVQTEFLKNDTKENFVRKQIINFDPDLILYHGSDIINKALQGILRKPIIIQILHTGVGPWTEDVLRTCNNINDNCIAVAKWIKEKFKNLYPITRMSTVYNGVKEVTGVTENFKEKFGIKTNDFVIGIMSRFSPEKRIDVILESMKYLPDNIKLLITGWGAEEENLKNISKSFGLDKRVIFTGVIHEREKFFNTIDISILVSSTEGNSMFLLESAMNKKPMVVTKVGAVEEMFKDSHSAIFVNDNSLMIANTISSVMENKELLKTIGDNAYQVVSRNASLSSMGQGYKDVFSSELERRIFPNTIWLQRCGGIGDMIMSTPSVRYLRKRFPDSIITYGTNKKFIDILIGNKNIDRIVEIGNGFSIENETKKYDLAIEFSHYEVWDTMKHIVSHYLELVGSSNNSDFEFDIDIEGVTIPEIKENYVCIHKKSNMPCKDWGNDEEWNKIISYITSRKLKPIIINEELNMSHRQITKLISKARMFIGVDSFPVHSAKFSKTPSVVIYGGASDPIFCGYKENMNIMPEINCKCDRSKSINNPCEKNLECLKSIAVERIIETIKIMEKR